MTIIIGIDPGLTGACAVLDHQGVRAVFDLPTMPVPGAGPKAGEPARGEMVWA